MMQKLKSRKFWACIVGVLVGMSAAFGLDEGVISQVAGIVTALASVVTYMVTEGRIDAAGVALAAQQVDALIEQVTQEQATLEADYDSGTD